MSAPLVQTAYSLGLAQIEEIADAVEELNRYKLERFGSDGWRSVAFTDTFENQAQYALASSFNEVIPCRLSRRLHICLNFQTDISTT